MNKHEHELMEAELSRLKPAQPPQQLIERMLAAVPVSPEPQRRPAREPVVTEWWLPLMRWLAPASAVALVAVVSLKLVPIAPNASAAGFNADDVQLSQELVSDFDAVGELPSGEPVRFRCREWKDSAVFHDSKRGLVVERNSPRLEVVPVAFETY